MHLGLGAPAKLHLPAGSKHCTGDSTSIDPMLANALGAAPAQSTKPSIRSSVSPTASTGSQPSTQLSIRDCSVLSFTRTSHFHFSRTQCVLHFSPIAFGTKLLWLSTFLNLALPALPQKNKQFECTKGLTHTDPRALHWQGVAIRTRDACGLRHSKYLQGKQRIHNKFHASRSCYKPPQLLTRNAEHRTACVHSYLFLCPSHLSARPSLLNSENGSSCSSPLSVAKAKLAEIVQIKGSYSSAVVCVRVTP